ncbi:MAG: KamA family radical SAM protein [Spirochaetaceae bacterium]|nr:MAG: KamA family radical SAM protein [Spirochaetaceae bacterium]
MLEANPEIVTAIRAASDVEDARRRVFRYVTDQEQRVFLNSAGAGPIETATRRAAGDVLKAVFSPYNEKKCGTSALAPLRDALTASDTAGCAPVSAGFLEEFRRLFAGVNGVASLPFDDEAARDGEPPWTDAEGERAASCRRSDELDRLAGPLHARVARYPNGLAPQHVIRRRETVTRIRGALGASARDWNDWRWQLAHVFRDERTISEFVELTDDESEAIETARTHSVPFGVTPHYLSLMERSSDRTLDHAIRAQVFPPLEYVEYIVANADQRGTSLDFMHEHETSPVAGVTRRYPLIAILKPYISCAQICVYCQRNWEIEDVTSARAIAPRAMIDAALSWFSEHPAITEILVTGGDPMLMPDASLAALLDRIAAIPHIERIRIGTRTPVALPQRLTPEIVEILAKHHVPGRREVCIVTHIEHPFELTPETVRGVTRIRRKGMSLYNQRVFTIENSRRFESVATRIAIKKIGIDPYYTFNTKGKEETRAYRVPIARILQERKEEARMLPGVVRTDEPVFNVPGIGKNYLRMLQDHAVIMISPAGERFYEFLPWDRNIEATHSYVHRDVPIEGYLRELKRRGEDPAEYDSIWYYY